MTRRPKCPRCFRTPATIVVTMRQFHRSAFNGYRDTASRLSEVRCLDCGHFWRTKAAWVKRTRTATDDERRRAISGGRPGAMHGPEHGSDEGSTS